MPAAIEPIVWGSVHPALADFIAAWANP